MSVWGRMQKRKGRVSAKRMTETVAENVQHTALTEFVLLKFLNLGFVGRMRWLLLGGKSLLVRK